MDEADQSLDRRAEIARRNHRRKLESRERKLIMMTVGLMAYSAFANVVAGITVLTSELVVAVIGIALGAFYAFGAYRVLAKDDTSWWPVAIPAGVSLVGSTNEMINGEFRPVPLLLNIALLILVVARQRASAATARAAADQVH